MAQAGALGEPENSELADLLALRARSAESRLLTIAPWAAGNSSILRGHALSAPFKATGCQSGRADEINVAAAISGMLNERGLSLPDSVSQPHHSPEYLDPDNWVGIHLPDRTGADHCKADYLLYNRSTGHYFALDVTSSVSEADRHALSTTLVAQGDDVRLEGKKASVSDDRRPYVLATTDDADAWLTGAGQARKQMADICARLITEGRPLDAFEQPLASANPLLPLPVQIEQMARFRDALARSGLSGWAGEVNSGIHALERIVSQARAQSARPGQLAAGAHASRDFTEGEAPAECYDNVFSLAEAYDRGPDSVRRPLADVLRSWANPVGALFGESDKGSGADLIFDDIELYARALAPLDVRAARVIARGADSLAVDLGDGTVMKVTRKDRPDERPFDLPVLGSGRMVDETGRAVNYFIQPLARIVAEGDMESVDIFKQRLLDMGFDPWDVREEQICYYDGRLYLVDPWAVQAPGRTEPPHGGAASGDTLDAILARLQMQEAE